MFTFQLNDKIHNYYVKKNIIVNFIIQKFSRFEGTRGEKKTNIPDLCPHYVRDSYHNQIRPKSALLAKIWMEQHFSLTDQYHTHFVAYFLRYQCPFENHLVGNVSNIYKHSFQEDLKDNIFSLLTLFVTYLKKKRLRKIAWIRSHHLNFQ